MSIFGQNPADITGALFKAKNFQDVPDKAAARNNLDVPSKADVLYNSVPVGMILPYWGSVAPAGYLPCSGQTVTSGTFPELVTFLGGGASQIVPDLRGEFLRGWDNGRGVDTGRSLASAQSDLVKTHVHFENTFVDNTNGVAGVSGVSGAAASGASVFGKAYGTNAATAKAYTAIDTNVGFSGANNGLQTGGISGVPQETRPRNVSVLYCIKAYSSVANYTSSVNIAGLVSDYSTLNSAAVKYADFTGTNQSTSSASGYQKLPGGLIIQWGSWTPHVTSGNSVAVIFPLAFPNTVRSIAVSSNLNLTTTTSSAWSSDTFLTGFNGRTNAAITSTCQYIAIGT